MNQILLQKKTARITLILLFCSSVYVPVICSSASKDRIKKEIITRVKLATLIDLDEKQSTILIRVGTTTVLGHYTESTEIVRGTGENTSIQDLEIGKNIYIFSKSNMDSVYIDIEKIVMQNKSRLARKIAPSVEDTPKIGIYRNISENIDDTYDILNVIAQYIIK